jgi:phage baseplate assembly protein gpV
MRTGDLYQRYYGVYLAKVVDVDDPEQLGRIRVECDQFEDADDDVIWAGVARPAAGDRTGVFFTPKVGDQVVLGYLVGDVAEPIVLGYAHSGQRPRAEQVDTQKHGIVTGIGSIVFDEQGRKITVTFDGPPASSITLDAIGLKIESKGVVEITGTAVVLNGVPAVRVNGALSVGPPLPQPGFPPLPPVPDPVSLDFGGAFVTVKSAQSMTFDTPRVEFVSPLGLLAPLDFCISGRSVVLINPATAIPPPFNTVFDKTLCIPGPP